MTQILTPDDILARIVLPPGAIFCLLSVTPPMVKEALLRQGSVTAKIKANSQADALQVACDVLRVFEGRRVLVRVPPEAESVKVSHMGWEHRGYVRFFYFNEPGEAVSRSILDKNTTAPETYLGWAV